MIARSPKFPIGPLENSWFLLVRLPVQGRLRCCKLPSNIIPDSSEHSINSNMLCLFTNTCIYWCPVIDKTTCGSYRYNLQKTPINIISTKCFHLNHWKNGKYNTVARRGTILYIKKTVESPIRPITIYFCQTFFILSRGSSLYRSWNTSGNCFARGHLQRNHWGNLLTVNHQNNQTMTVSKILWKKTAHCYLLATTFYTYIVLHVCLYPNLKI